MPERHRDHRARRSGPLILCLSVLSVTLCPIVRPTEASDSSTQPTDAGVDWILSHPTTAPSTKPTTNQISPLVDSHPAKTRTGTITLSDGTKLTGEISTTTDKPLRVFDENAKQYTDVPFDQVVSIKASVLWERDEKEWQFKLSGSDEKVYSGKTYPARETSYTITTADGNKISGSIAAPIYFKSGDQRKIFILHKRDKGEVGQTVKQLLYVDRIDLDQK